MECHTPITNPSHYQSNQEFKKWLPSNCITTNIKSNALPNMETALQITARLIENDEIEEKRSRGKVANVLIQAAKDTCEAHRKPVDHRRPRYSTRAPTLRKWVTVRNKARETIPRRRVINKTEKRSEDT